VQLVAAITSRGGWCDGRRCTVRWARELTEKGRAYAAEREAAIIAGLEAGKTREIAADTGVASN